MIKQEDTQFKMLALQASQGDLDKAKQIYAWLTEEEFQAEVERVTEQKVAQQLELFPKESNDAE